MYTITGTLYYYIHEKENGISVLFFFCLHPKKTPGHPLNFQLGFLFVAPAGTAIVIDCVWCVFNVEPNEVWHQHHLRQMRIVKKKNPGLSASVHSSFPFRHAENHKTKDSNILRFLSISLIATQCDGWWWCIIWFRWRVAKALSYIRISGTSRSWPDDIYSPGEIWMLWRLWIDFHGPSTC